MKKMSAAVILAVVCIFLFAGCSLKEKTAGVYITKDKEELVLLKDGTGFCYGYDDIVWKVQKDTVTVTRKDADEYYIDAYVDETVTDAYMKAIASKCNWLEDTYSCQLYQDERRISIRIPDAELFDQMQEEVQKIEGIARTEQVVKEGKVYEYTFNVLDNCLVDEYGTVYIKQES